jgi:hypothetical protein
MNGKLLLGIIDYFFMATIFLFALLSLVLRDQRKKLVFLFLMFLSFSVLSFLFFTGATFIIVGILIICFLIPLYLNSFNEQFYNKGIHENMKLKLDSDENKKIKNKKIKRYINLALSVIFCSGAGYLFYHYTLKYISNYKQVTSIVIISFKSVVLEIGNNYSAIIMILVLILVITILWFISILERSNDSNINKDDSSHRRDINIKKIVDSDNSETTGKTTDER